jgi:hypothetical protein
MGKRTWLTHLLDAEILPAIAPLKNTPHGRKKCQHLAQLLRDRWAEHGQSTLQQQQSLMDQTRRTIKDRFGADHFSLDSIAFTREEHFELNRQKQGNARDRQLQQRYLENPDAIVAKAVKLLDSPEWADVACGLAVVTGRRLNEVLKTGEFERKSHWIVTFRGALKRRGETVPLVFEIPVLTTANRVIKAVETLRRITPHDANEAQVAIVSDRHFADLVPTPPGKDHLYAHLWRSVFCCIATFWYCPKHVDDLLFKAHILGHFETLTEDEKRDERQQQHRLETFSSERHYRLYEIDDVVIAHHHGKRKGIKLGMGGIVPLAAFVAGLPEHQAQPGERQPLSAVRFPKDHHDALVDVLHHFDGKNQPEKVAQWIAWSQQQLNAQSREVEPQGTRSQEGVEADTMPNPVSPVEDIPLTEPTPSAPTLDSPPPSISNGLEAKLDQLVEVMTQFIQVQLQHQTPTPPAPITPAPSTPLAMPSAPAVPTQQTASIQASTPEPQPRKYKTGQADAIVNAAIDAIMHHNNQPNQPHDLKWEITINGLKNYTANQRVIERIVQERRDEIDAHHHHHQIQPGHNHRHKRKRKLAEVISLGGEALTDAGS